MPADTDLPEILTTYGAFALAIAAGFYGGTVWFGKHLAQESKQTLTLWLRGDYDSTWSHNFCNFFDTVFGERHLSWQCFLRSSLASVGAVVLLYILFTQILGVMGGRAPGELSLWQAVLFGAVINVVPDYLSLFETRWLLRQFERVQSVLGQLGVLIADAFFTGAIIWLCINAFQWVRGDASLTAVEMLALFSVFSVFFYSTFLTSAWAWIYCLSTWFMRLFSRTALSRLLDVEKNPVSQIALIGSALIFACSIALTPALRPEGEGQISAFDDKLCQLFPAEVCGRVAALTSDEKKALDYFGMACEGGAVEHCNSTAIEYFRGDKIKAATLWRKACEGGEFEGCARLGAMYFEGIGVAQNRIKAANLYRQSCAGGYTKGCYLLASLYILDPLIDLDPTEVYTLFRQVCDDGMPEGCYGLAWMYHSGRGVSQNYAKAAALYAVACSGELAYGCNTLGRLYHSGLGVTQDDAKAERQYHLACLLGDPEGCYLQGLMFASGSGVAQDDAKAVLLFRQACEGGEPHGCTNLGGMYLYGRGGMMQDDAKAASLFQQGCGGGDALGCSNLGWMFQNGLGVPRDVARAEWLYREACDDGEATACTNLREMREVGRLKQ